MREFEIKKNYLQGCEPNQFREYLNRPVLRYTHNARFQAIGLSLPYTGRVLDVGCGFALLEQNLLSRRSNLEIVGVDLNREAVKFAKRRFSHEFILCDAEHLPFRDQSFDAVVATEVMEHLPNPIVALKDIKRVSRSLVVVSVPNLVNLTFLRAVGKSRVPIHEVNLLGVFGKFLRFVANILIEIISGWLYIHVSNAKYFDYRYYAGVPHRLYKMNYFKRLLNEAGLKCENIVGSTIIPQFAPEKLYPLIKHFSNFDKAIARSKPKLGLVVIAECTAK